MSDIINNSISIYQAMQNIQNSKYVMPAFQRQYVWSMEQIEKLWDSILLGYPIATFLFWHIDEDNTSYDTYFCKFLKAVTFSSSKIADNINFEISTVNTKISNTAILDGQQRLTSLYLSLFGTTYIREKHARKKTFGGNLAKLYVNLNKWNKFEDEISEYNSMQYDIKFTDKPGNLRKGYFLISNIISPDFECVETRALAINKAVDTTNPDDKEYANLLLNKLCEKIYDEKLINYTEIYNIQQDNALEMFVRFNSGGKALKPSEITMSILEAYWPNARTEIGRLLTDSYTDFGTDFIIRTALLLYGNVEKTIIDKQIADNLKNNWQNFRKALRNLESFLNDINVSISRFSGTWNVLLPLIYFVYKNHEYKNFYKEMKAYLTRAILFNFFNSGTKGKLKKIKKIISDNANEITLEMLDNMQEFKVTDSRIEDILNSEKGSRIAYEAMYYLNLDWLDNNVKYEQDHLHPENRFSDDNLKPAAIKFTEWKEWKGNRNRLPNLHRLEGRENASKSDMSLEYYVDTMLEEQKKVFYKQAIINPSISLEFDNFGRFYADRKNLLSQRLRKIFIGEC